jgi:hypothetical protein
MDGRRDARHIAGVMAALRYWHLAVLASCLACNYAPSQNKQGSAHMPIGVPTGPPSPPPMTTHTQPVLWEYSVTTAITPPASPAIISSWICTAFSGSITDTATLTAATRSVGYDSSGAILCSGGGSSGPVGFIAVNLQGSTITPVIGSELQGAPTFAFCPGGPPPAVPCISLNATVVGTDTLSGPAVITVARSDADSTVALGTFTAVQAPSP